MKLLEFINKKTNNAYKDFKLVSVIFDEKNLSCTFKFLYKDFMSDNTKEELSSLISEYINEEINVIVKCKKAYVDAELVRDVIYNFISRNFSSLGINFNKENIVVDLMCNEFQKEHIVSSEIDREIITYANSFFFEDFILNIVENNEKVSDNLENLIPTIDINLAESTDLKISYTKVIEVTPFIDEVSGNPINISCINSNMENIEVAGEIKYLTQKSFQSKRKDNDGNAIVKTYYNFVIFDKTGRINCVYFPTKNDIEKALTIADGQFVIVRGELDSYNDKNSLKVKSIAFCEIVPEEEKIENIEFKNVNEKYITIKPQPHVDIVQDNLFAEKIDVGKYLMENDVVVFDIETTGLDASKCEIIEIGAVKISKGRISETFETLIKPMSVIPEEIIKLTGITPDMVLGAPSIGEVIPDFYKFCYGTTIMAYNIDFDYKFINLFGLKYGYNFNMKQVDVLFLARSFVLGLSNFKLSTVCKKLNISLENAHRAVHDALATAEVVLKLGPNIT